LKPRYWRVEISENPNPPSAFGLFNEIGIIAQLSRAYFEARLPDGLLLPHFGVLNHLTRVGNGRTPLMLARAFQVPKTTMTHTLIGLEKRGLVDMRPNPEDGRSKLVWMTEAGRKYRDEAIAQISPDVVTILDQLEGIDIAALTGQLMEIREVLDRNRD